MKTKLSKEQTKRHNSELVFNIIYNNNLISRAEISRIAKLTKSTVSILVDEYIEKGLVQETGKGESKGGRRPILLSVDKNSRQVIGVDLTDDIYKGSVYNLKGESHYSMEIVLSEKYNDCNFSILSELIHQLIKNANSEILGIGLGVPGIIDNRSGIIKKSTNKLWENVPISQILQKRHNYPFLVANDSHSAALAEYLYGDEKIQSHLIMLKVGSGVGVGIIINGKLYLGDDSAAGEIGHIAFSYGKERCACGSYGCLETLVTTKAIIRKAQELFRNNRSAYLRKIAPNENSITIEHIIQAANNNDEQIIQLITTVGEQLGCWTANIAALLNIKNIKLSGDIVSFGERIITPIKEKVEILLPKTLQRNIKISSSSLGPDIVSLGAATLLIKKQLGV